jgi:hypothetical protein
MPTSLPSKWFETGPQQAHSRRDGATWRNDGPNLIQWTNSYTEEIVAITTNLCGSEEEWLRFQRAEALRRAMLA